MTLPINAATQKDFRDDLTVSGSPWGVMNEVIVPVKAIGQGLPTPNNSQALKSYVLLKNAASGVSYTQVATVSSSERIYFVGAHVSSVSDVNNDDIYIEDASSGNIFPSDGSTTGLMQFVYNEWVPIGTILPFPRECKRGIRVKVSNSATSTMVTLIIVYYLVVRIEGGLQPL